jgi:hypothetical protein
MNEPGRKYEKLLPNHQSYISFRKRESKTKMKNIIIRSIFMLTLVLSVLGVSTSAALADSPVKYQFTLNDPGILTDTCSFPVNIYPNTLVTAMDFFDKNGALIRTEGFAVEQDMFTANGKTLYSVVYKYNGQFLYDSSGNFSHVYVNGPAVKVPLPDGSLFIAAGRSDFMAHPGASFILTPDKGNPGNIAGFCAALAP